MIKVSFIIPSYNSYKTISLTIESIFRQDLFRFVNEILIVDSSDDRRTLDVIAQYSSPKIKIVTLNQKTPPGKARNIGVLYTLSELLCFVDSDVVLHETWLNKIQSSVQQGCLAGCGSVSIPKSQMNKRIAFAQLYLEFNEFLDAGAMRNINMVPACNMFIQKKLFDVTGGFPDTITAEDVLISLNIKKLTQLWFIPEAKCFHIFRENIQSYCANQKLIGQGNIIYRWRVDSQWFYAGLWPILLLPGFILIKIWRIHHRIYSAGWKHYRKYLSSIHLFGLGLFFWGFGVFKACAKLKRLTIPENYD